MQSTQQAIFSVGDEEYGLDIMDVNVIEKFTAVEQVANSPKNIKGIINLRGDIIPVYSLRRKFGLNDIQPDDETRFIITTSDGILMAYEVDKMQEISQLMPEQINEVPPIVKSKDTAYLKSITNKDGRLIILMNADGIVSDEEQNGIKAILAKKQAK
jgi:purine-binding chemotaxis protein CheW